MHEAPANASPMKLVQVALANWRDGSDIALVHPEHGLLNLEEVKYTVVDPAVEAEDDSFNRDLELARGLLEGSEPGDVHPEYLRGMAELLAELHPVQGITTGQRARRIEQFFFGSED